MKREIMRKQALRLLKNVKEEDFESLLWCMRQFAAERLNEAWRQEQMFGGCQKCEMNVE